MEDKQSQQSEWNEQQQFSQLFFQITRGCRECQVNREAIRWEDMLESKISLVMGVATKEEKEILIGIRKTLIISINQIGSNPTWKKLAPLFNQLFYAESQVDTIACKHMPFLKLKRQVDIGGL